MTGVELIASERSRQIGQEGWDASHDDRHIRGELLRAALGYAARSLHLLMGYPLSGLLAPVDWPWEFSWWKPSSDPIPNLVKAGALIAAEIDRLQRAADLERAPIDAAD